MLLINHYAFTIAYNRAILDVENECINNGYPPGSIEYDAYNSGLASKGVTE